MSDTLPPVEAYARSIAALMPRGKAWPDAGGPNWRALMSALAPELRRIDGRAIGLIEEADPRTAVETLADYERVLGLPDPCFGSPATIEERRNLVVALLSMKGGSSPEYFVQLCANFGHAITVEEVFPCVSGALESGDEMVDEARYFETGVSVSGDPMGDHAHPLTWYVTARATVFTDFESGVAETGDYMGTADNPLVRCLIDRFKPAHTRAVFIFEETDP